MKTTLDIDDALLANAKALAAQQRTSLTRLIEEGLQLRLRSAVATPRARAQEIPVFKGHGGLVADLDATSNKAMLDAATQPVAALKGMVRKRASPISIASMNSAIAAQQAKAR